MPTILASVVDDERRYLALGARGHDWTFTHDQLREASMATLRSLLRSSDPAEQAAAAHLMADIANPSRQDDPRLATLASRAIDRVDHLHVVWAIADALRFLTSLEAIPGLAIAAAHPAAAIRVKAAEGLGTVLVAAGDRVNGHEQVMQQGWDVLMRLLHDRSTRVREWAVLSLGALAEQGSPSADQLLECVKDRSASVRAEAISALAEIHDPRAKPYILLALQEDTVYRIVVKAAATLPDQTYLPALQALRDWWDVDPELLTKALDATSAE
jgi:HEAT repeat protein